jgi:hypothetical protein
LTPHFSEYAWPVSDVVLVLRVFSGSFITNKEKRTGIFHPWTVTCNMPHLWFQIKRNKMCYETQMPPYKANSRGGHHRQNPRSRFQNLWLQYKGLVIRNIHIYKIVKLTMCKT